MEARSLIDVVSNTAGLSSFAVFTAALNDGSSITNSTLCAQPAYPPGNATLNTSCTRLYTRSDMVGFLSFSLGEEGGEEGGRGGGGRHALRGGRHALRGGRHALRGGRRERLGLLRNRRVRLLPLLRRRRREVHNAGVHAGRNLVHMRVDGHDVSLPEREQSDAIGHLAPDAAELQQGFYRRLLGRHVVHGRRGRLEVRQG